MTLWWKPSVLLPRHDEIGQSGIEFAVVLPFLFLFLFLAAEAAYLLGTWIILEQAANVGTRYAAVGDRRRM